jgi:hypothetical protein
MQREEKPNFYEIVEMLYYSNRNTHYIKIWNYMPMSEWGHKYKIALHYLYMIEVLFADDWMGT